MHTLLKKLTFKALPYDFAALEPYIDSKTMELHYTKHHKGYFDKLTAAIEKEHVGHAEVEDISFEDLLRKISSYSTAIRNNGGGHYNHTLFWSVLSPNGKRMPEGGLAEEIVKQFGSFEQFKEEFNNAAASRFGSGWAWLVVDSDKKLVVCSTPNQDNPLMDVSECNGMPILGIDVWEHAYYLKYQNRRPDYIEAFWNLVHWDEVERRYKEAIA